MESSTETTSFISYSYSTHNCARLTKYLLFLFKDSFAGITHGHTDRCEIMLGLNVLDTINGSAETPFQITTYPRHDAMTVPPHNLRSALRTSSTSTTPTDFVDKTHYLRYSGSSTTCHQHHHHHKIYKRLHEIL